MIDESTKRLQYLNNAMFRMNLIKRIKNSLYKQKCQLKIDDLILEGLIGIVEMQKVADRVGYILSNIDTEYLIEIRDAAFVLGIAIDSRLKKQQQIVKENAQNENQKN